MITLYEQVEKAAVSFNIHRRKDAFIPHLTIGRTTRPYRKIDVLPFLEYVYSPIGFDINSVGLYESQRLAHGAEYKVLTTFPLN